jgi:hypothetical protein
MKNTFKHNVMVGKRSVDLLECLTNVKSKMFELILLGTGELGPADGSQIDDLDNYGYARFPTFEPEWNQIVPQANKGYSEFEHYILPWMAETYGEDIQILISGHSLGAQQAIEYITGYKGLKVTPQVVGFMPVAGRVSGPTPDWHKAVDLPVRAISGDNDNAIKYYNSENLVKALNAVPGKHKAEFVKLPGVSHGGAMHWAFTPDRNHDSYKWKKNLFNWDRQTIECPATLDERNLKATFHLPEGDKSYGLIPDK